MNLICPLCAHPVFVHNKFMTPPTHSLGVLSGKGHLNPFCESVSLLDITVGHRSYRDDATAPKKFRKVIYHVVTARAVPGTIQERTVNPFKVIRKSTMTLLNQFNISTLRTSCEHLVHPQFMAPHTVWGCSPAKAILNPFWLV
jgi:hypothetical protein